MGERTHTPGPWRVEVSELDDGKPFVSIRAATDVAYLSLNPEQVCANGALVAAAPDMFAVLDEILNYSGGAESALHDPYVMERAAAALAKALGKEGGR